MRLDSFEEARRLYVDYHVSLSDAGIYSCAGILLSVSRALFRPGSDGPPSSKNELAIFDGASASGLRTIADLGLEPLLDIRPQSFLRHLAQRERWRFAAALAAVAGSPRRFFELFFDVYAAVAERVLNRNPACRSVVAANERSLGCAPFLATARFRHHRKATVVQHGNPVCDFLPTLADEYWCRSDRWFQFLQDQAVVPRIRRIADFPALNGVAYNPDCRRAVLVLHNVGYLEPDLDYRSLSAKIKEACAKAGWTLHALRHPANDEAYGLPVVDRRMAFEAALAIGFRSTATDQLPEQMPRVSLLDYWPDFFLRQGSLAQLDHYLLRIDEALT